MYRAIFALSLQAAAQTGADWPSYGGTHAAWRGRNLCDCAVH